jgi:hypothetical protein
MANVEARKEAMLAATVSKSRIVNSCEQ